MERQSRLYRDKQLEDLKAQTDSASYAQASAEAKMRRDHEDVVRQMRAAHEAEMRRAGREIMRLQRALDRQQQVALSPSKLRLSASSVPLSQTETRGGGAYEDSEGSQRGGPAWAKAIEGSGVDLTKKMSTSGLNWGSLYTSLSEQQQDQDQNPREGAPPNPVAI